MKNFTHHLKSIYPAVVTIVCSSLVVTVLGDIGRALAQADDRADNPLEQLLGTAYGLSKVEIADDGLHIVGSLSTDYTSPDSFEITCPYPDHMRDGAPEIFTTTIFTDNQKIITVIQSSKAATTACDFSGTVCESVSTPLKLNDIRSVTEQVHQQCTALRDAIPIKLPHAPHRRLAASVP